MELLQKVRSRSASCRVRSPEAYSSAAVRAPMGIASHQPQQQRGPGAAGQAEQGRHQASHIGRQPLSEAQPHQQTGDDHEGEQGGDHRPGAEGQGLGCLEPQLSGIRQKPDQDPAQDQAHIRPYPPFHTHHPLYPMRGGGGSYGGTGKPGGISA